MYCYCCTSVLVKNLILCWHSFVIASLSALCVLVQTSVVVVCMVPMLCITFVLHSNWVASAMYSSPSIVLASTQPDGSKFIIDDFREVCLWNSVSFARLIPPGTYVLDLWLSVLWMRSKAWLAARRAVSLTLRSQKHKFYFNGSETFVPHGSFSFLLRFSIVVGLFLVARKHP